MVQQKRKPSTAGLDRSGSTSAKMNPSKYLARGYSTQTITHMGKKVLFEISTDVTRDIIFQSAIVYETTIKYRLADRKGKPQDLAFFKSYGIDKQHPKFQEEFLPTGHFRHLGAHGPVTLKDIQDSQKIMLMTHDRQGPYSHPKVSMAQDHRRLFRDSKTYHYLSEFELADRKHRGMGWGPVLMLAWLTSLGNTGDGLEEYSFTGLFLLSPAPIGGELYRDDYLRVVHSLVRQYNKSGYELLVHGDDKLDGPIYIMGQQFPKRAALPKSTMFAPGAFSVDVPDSPLTPPPDGEFEEPPNMPKLGLGRKPRIVVDERAYDLSSSEDEDPVKPRHRRKVGLRLPRSRTSADVTMQDSSEDEDPRAMIERRLSLARSKAQATNPSSRSSLRVPQPASLTAQSVKGKYTDKYINTNIAQATQRLTISHPPARPIKRIPILRRGNKPPRPGLDYPWHDRKVYLVTPDTPQEWIEQGWAWYRLQLATREQNSASAQAVALTPASLPVPIVEQKPRRYHYEVVESNGKWPARSILGDTKRQYLIDWEDHPVTGEKFEPTWEPKWNAKEALVEAWERTRKR